MVVGERCTQGQAPALYYVVPTGLFVYAELSLFQNSYATICRPYGTFFSGRHTGRLRDLVPSLVRSPRCRCRPLMPCAADVRWLWRCCRDEKCLHRLVWVGRCSVQCKSKKNSCKSKTRAMTKRRLLCNRKKPCLRCKEALFAARAVFGFYWCAMKHLQRASPVGTTCYSAEFMKQRVPHRQKVP